MILSIDTSLYHSPIEDWDRLLDLNWYKYVNANIYWTEVA
jgi:hypothetical protein